MFHRCDFFRVDEFIQGFSVFRRILHETYYYLTDSLLAVFWKQNRASSNRLTRQYCNSPTVQGTQIGLAFVCNKKRERGIKIVIPTLKFTCLVRLRVSLPTRPDNQLQATRKKGDSLFYYFRQENRGSG